MQKPNPWKRIGGRVVYKNPWIKVREDKVIKPSGGQGIYSVVETDDSVMIVALNNQNEIYLINSFSYPEQSWSWGLPGGGGAKEHPLQAARRELLEETGFKATAWQKLGETRICDGLMTEHMHSFLARGLVRAGESEQSDEPIAGAKFVPLSTVRDMIQKGEISSSQSITAIYLATEWLKVNS